MLFVFEKFFEVVFGDHLDKLREKLRGWPLRRRVALCVLVMLAALAAIRPSLPVTLWKSGKRLAVAGLEKEDVPLSGHTITKLDYLIGALGHHLHARFREREQLPPSHGDAINGWEIGQFAVALDGLALSGLEPIPRQRFLSLFSASLSEDCGCYRERFSSELQMDVPHVGANAWVLYAYGRLGEQPPRSIISFLIDRQSPEGSWAMFPLKAESRELGSTYATAWSTLALHTAVKRKLVPANLIDDATQSLNLGLNWLAKSMDAQTWDWDLYPYSKPRQPSSSATALAMFLLSEAQPQLLSERAKEAFIGRLPAEVPAPSAADAYNQDLETPWGMRREAVRLLKLPWLVIGTAEAYRRASLLERYRLLSFVERIVEEDSESWIADTRWDFIAAELLISLRHLRQGYLHLLES
ncbi:MAG TPA: hypothetical protein VF017_11255 [Thermoanaerobaculia bacterium]|nr:hypothetical protein [Thermoanaerobaculia bacterium]